MSRKRYLLIKQELFVEEMRKILKCGFVFIGKVLDFGIVSIWGAKIKCTDSACGLWKMGVQYH